jgi:hypothetical protein
VTSPALPPAVAAYLDDQHVMTLATSGADGPWAAAVFYARREHELLFMSSPQSRHCRDLSVNPCCAATVQANERDWVKIRACSCKAGSARSTPPDQAHALAHYAAKFPLASSATAPAVIAAAMAKVHWYRLHIERPFFIDNSRGFGRREQIDLDRSRQGRVPGDRVQG